MGNRLVILALLSAFLAGPASAQQWAAPSAAPPSDDPFPFVQRGRDNCKS